MQQNQINTREKATVYLEKCIVPIKLANSLYYES